MMPMTDMYALHLLAACHVKFCLGSFFNYNVF